VIWHNDDWGQTWAHLLEPMDDVEAKFASSGTWTRSCRSAEPEHRRAEGQTFSVFTTCSDLVKPEEVPKARWFSSSPWQKLQPTAGGIRRRRRVDEQPGSLVLVDVGHNCDVLVLPLRARQQEAAEAGWK
jgi:hypothetical protein